MSQAPPVPTGGISLPGFLRDRLKDNRARAGEINAGTARRRFDVGLRTKGSDAGSLPIRCSTLASIIEREAANPAERPLISAVYHNRLLVGMSLQADPRCNTPWHLSIRAMLLAVSGNEISRWMIFRVPSPFNTYREAGLPPGPIRNPGIDSIRAAVEPAPVDFMYFVAKGDGLHAFARTEAEHRANVELYRQP